MVFPPLLVFLGTANTIYAYLNLKLLKGLANLSKPRPAPPTPLPTVTVLIAARNEEDRIRSCLECLRLQDYDMGKLQVIVVDDRSTDGTASILKEYADRWPGRFDPVSLTATAPGFSPKKYALSQGLLKATGEIIVTTDADCIMSPAWISTLVSEFGEDTGLVLGMTSYYSMPKETFGAGIQALDFLSHGVVAAALIGLRFPVHGNANNIAYRRKVYDQSAGFASHGGIVSGDDDFLIQSIHKLGRWRIRYSVQPESQVQTEPPLSIRQFWEQRKRWASKTSLYQSKQTAFLAGIFAYYSLIPVCILAGIFHRGLLAVGLASWGVKLVSDWLVMRKGTRLFAKPGLMRHYAGTSLVHIPLIIAAVLAGSFGEFTWKGTIHRRRVKSAEGSDGGGKMQGRDIETSRPKSGVGSRE
ncbi:MAG: glycosyltransferase, group 2 family [Fibrobacteres bacterium]|nr:glycosyltransferase, group 2 family [Fibrobacterota bacterium]